MNWQLFYALVWGVFLVGFVDFYVSRPRPSAMRDSLWWGLLGVGVVLYSVLYWGGIITLSNAGRL